MYLAFRGPVDNQADTLLRTNRIDSTDVVCWCPALLRASSPELTMLPQRILGLYAAQFLKNGGGRSIRHSDPRDTFAFPMCCGFPQQVLQIIPVANPKLFRDAVVFL